MVMGAGPPLVMLPGLAPENRRPVGAIRNGELQTMAQYARDFTVYWLGRPVGMADGTTFADITAATAEALTLEFDRPVNVLGISTGGSIAQQLAASYPELVRRLALVSTGCRLGAHAAATQQEMIKIAARGNARQLMAAFAWDIVPAWRGRIPLAALMYGFGPRLYPGGRDVKDLYLTLVAEDAFDLRALPTITAPTLIVNGGRDRFYEPEIVHETARLIPGSTLLVREKRGHVTVVSDRRAVATTIGFLGAPTPPLP
ncbi:MAG: alpha/beta hydrolase fold protein [Jatrophihabitans sp.]|nr:alpha/beta hydrolase fold protein [Jatrophihabitans sp.]